MGSVRKYMIFVGRTWKYYTVEVRFVTKDMLASHATKFLRRENVTLLLKYNGRRINRLHIGRVKAEMKRY